MVVLVQSPLGAEEGLQRRDTLALEQAASMAEAQLMNSLSSLRSALASSRADDAADDAEERSETQTAIKQERRPTLKLEIKLETSPRPSEPTSPATTCNRKPNSPGSPTKAGSKPQRTGFAVTALDLLGQILGIDIRGRVQESSTQCLATAKTKAARCRIAVRAQNKQLILASLDVLAEMKVRSDLAGCAEKLAAFVDLTCCGRHHRSQARESVDKWMSKNSKVKDGAVSPTASTKSVPAGSSVKSEASYGAPKELKQEVKDEADLVWATSPHHRDTAPTWPPRYDLRPTAQRMRNMKKYEPEPWSCRCFHIAPPRTQAVSQHISTTINKTLGVRALNGGFLYVYRLSSEKDFFKIGFTTVGVNHRIKQWERQCGHKAEVVYPTSGAQGVRIGNVYRVEQLIHAELREYRYREEGCEGCGKNHVEWFKVGEEHIRAVIEKWVEWIREKPYEEDEDGVWRLKKQAKTDVDRMCTPLKVQVSGPDADWEPQVPVRSSTLVRA